MIKIIAPKRGWDAFGSGEFGASRGSRKHRGIDYWCPPGAKILSNISGIVSKIGYPYNPQDEGKGHFRYVEITDNEGFRVRYFYVKPSVSTGDVVCRDSEIGESQDISSAYPPESKEFGGKEYISNPMKNHTHLEVISQGGEYINPETYMAGGG